MGGKREFDALGPGRRGWELIGGKDGVAILRDVDRSGVYLVPVVADWH